MHLLNFLFKKTKTKTKTNEYINDNFHMNGKYSNKSNCQFQTSG